MRIPTHLPKDLKVLARRAEEQGWDLRQTGGGHLKWIAPSGAFVFTASTPSDHRAYKNILSSLRRRGFVS